MKVKGKNESGISLRENVLEFKGRRESRLSLGEMFWMSERKRKVG